MRREADSHKASPKGHAGGKANKLGSSAPRKVKIEEGVIITASYGFTNVPRSFAKKRSKLWKYDKPLDTSSVSKRIGRFN